MAVIACSPVYYSETQLLRYWNCEISLQLFFKDIFHKLPCILILFWCYVTNNNRKQNQTLYVGCQPHVRDIRIVISGY